MQDPYVDSVDSKGRRRRVYWDSTGGTAGLLGVPRRQRWGHPAYGLDYAWAVSYEYQMLLIDLFAPSRWGAYVLELTAGLDFPRHSPETDSYAGMVAHYKAVAEGVKEVRHALVDAVAPFAARHGLNPIPWGLGWLYEKLPRGASTERVAVTADMALVDVPQGRKTVDRRLHAGLTALLVYLRLTGGLAGPRGLADCPPLACPGVHGGISNGGLLLPGQGMARRPDQAMRPNTTGTAHQEGQGEAARAIKMGS